MDPRSIPSARFTPIRFGGTTAESTRNARRFQLRGRDAFGVDDEKSAASVRGSRRWFALIGVIRLILA
jgi:hypothetical protein